MVVTDTKEALAQAVEEFAQKVDELEALAQGVYDEEFHKESPNNQIGDTRIKLLNMWANIGSLCRMVRSNELNQIWICLSIAKDIEKELGELECK